VFGVFWVFRMLWVLRMLWLACHDPYSYLCGIWVSTYPAKQEHPTLMARKLQWAERAPVAAG